LAKKRYFHLVGTGPKPGKEAEYNEWYNNHVKLLFQFKGLIKVSRTHLCEPVGRNGSLSPQYVTIYEFESRQDFTEFCQSPVMKVADKDYADFGVPVADIFWAGGYETITVLSRES
jgi:heme-degrading monooxygenase HmoA